MGFLIIVYCSQRDINLILENLVVERYIMPGAERIGGLNSLGILPQSKISAYCKFISKLIVGAKIEIASEPVI